MSAHGSIAYPPYQHEGARADCALFPCRGDDPTPTIFGPADPPEQDDEMTESEMSISDYHNELCNDRSCSCRGQL